MLNRRPLLGLTAACFLLCASASPAATFRTQNFLVDAPTPKMAQQFGQMAEVYRKQKAIEWLGQEIPPWPRPCPLRVRPGGSPGGATTFTYDYRGGYDIASMNIEGPEERMLNSVLPHEVTHTVFAHHFRYPVPRWADEGGSVLSEDDAERGNHDRMCRNMLNANQAIPLRRLFQVREYAELHGNVLALYAQGFSVTNYLVGLGGRQTFLNFVAAGLQGNWDTAVQSHYRVQSIDALEEGWLRHLRETKQRSLIAAAPRQPNASGSMVAAANSSFVRNTAPPAQPDLDAAGPVVRGQSQDWPEDPRPGTATLTGRPSHLPDAPTIAPVRVPPPRTAPPPPPVRLGLPEFTPAPLPQ